MIYNNIFELIGNTPVVKISDKVHGIKNLNLFVKLEYQNPFGSLKDRMAWEMVKDDLDKIKNGKIIIENSSGNTAKALQVIASVYGSHLKTITNRIKNHEKKMILQVLGAEVQELPGKSQCYDPSDPNDPLAHTEREVAASPDKYLYTDQYFNEKNVHAHYQGTGKEILEDIGRIDYFFSGLGTTGSTKGITKALKENNKKTKSVGVIASSMDVIPGIRNSKEMFEVGLFDSKIYDDILEVSALNAIDASLELIRKSGILVGPTGGATYSAILNYFKGFELKRQTNAVFLACDRFEWYLSYYKDLKPEIFGDNANENSIKRFKDISFSKDISPEELVEMLNKKENLQIVDIRSNIAYKVGHISKSINIPDEEFERMIDKSNPFPNETTVVVVCPNGELSKLYSAYLRKNNIKSYSLAGGIFEWKRLNSHLESTFKKQ